MAPPDAISFGPFHLQPARQLLLEGARPLEIGSRALDILTALVERPGDLVTKEELVARAWPDTTVDESNLRAQVAALRKVLRDGRRGARYLVTVPGRGYRFVAPVSREAKEAEAGGTPARLDNRPARLTRVVGRADLVSAVGGRLQRRRFVTIVGPGGIGKTTVASAVADAVIASYEHGVCFVDLAPLTDERLAATALGSALGLAIVAEDSTPAVVAFLRERRMLLVLDSCEHVVEAAAVLAERVLKGAPGVHVLATSREPLRAEGELVQRVGPLEVPPQSESLSAAEALAYPAVELFAARAAGCLAGFELTDADAPVVAEICRKLDGIALAIELVAGRVDAFGIRGVAARLDDRLRLLTHGRRTALARHQTLSAALDWSYEFLPDAERAVLRRLAVFAGGFTLPGASAVAADAAIPAEDVPDLVADLVAKSLVAADLRHETGLYRLLDTTRAYALAKLTEAGEFRRVSRRHAQHCRDRLLGGVADWEQTSIDEWSRTHGHWIDDLRASLGWAFGAGGDAELATALTLAAVPLWMHLSMMVECRERVERALANVDPDAARGARSDMQLFAALGAARMYTQPPGPEVREAWTRALELAERLEDTDYQLRALWGIWSAQLNTGEFRAALATAEQFGKVAETSSDPLDRAVGDRLIGGALHIVGDLAGARARTESMLRGVAAPQRSHLSRFVVDQRLMARNTLAGVLWLQGLRDQAAALSVANLEEARATDHALTVCSILSDSICPIALLNGDFAAAERYAKLLVELTAAHSLELWSVWARCFNGALVARRLEGADALGVLHGSLEDLLRAQLQPRYMTLLADLAESLGRAGDAPVGLAAIEDALARCEASEERWCFAELLRVKGELLQAQGGRGAMREAEQTLREARDWARKLGSLSWELRSALSLARLRPDGARARDAREGLGSVYGRFAEGFGTSDLVAARGLLDQLN